MTKGPYAGCARQRTSSRVSILAPYLLLPCAPPTHAHASLLAHKPVTIWFLLKITFIFPHISSEDLGKAPSQFALWVIFGYVSAADQEGAGNQILHFICVIVGQIMIAL